MVGAFERRAGNGPAAAFAVALAVVCLIAALPARADADGERWVRSFWPVARDAGIAERTYRAALADFTPDPDVLERASNQAEFVKPIGEYLSSAVSVARIERGRAMLERYAPELGRIEAHFGVDRHILVAIWGMESSYGAVFENGTRLKNVVRSLATLAYSGGSRAGFGAQQLVAVLTIIQRHGFAASEIVGSWAGAMGHTQFIPTTYLAYAVDFDGSGHPDVWNSSVDALASAANYLAKSGWEKGKTWGYEVVLPRGLDLAAASSPRSLDEWAHLGIRRPNGRNFPRPSDNARLLLPAGAGGAAFLMLKNFHVIKRYNNADAYALAVGHLADRLRGGEAIAASWPADERPLSEEDRAALQRLLAARGYYGGTIDAKLGSSSRDAIRAYQSAAGLPADGHPSSGLLQRLRAGG